VFDMFASSSPATGSATHPDAEDWQGYPLRKDYSIIQQTSAGCRKSGHRSGSDANMPDATF